MRGFINSSLVSDCNMATFSMIDDDLRSVEKLKFNASGIASVEESNGSYPAIASKVLATNSTDLPIGPADILGARNRNYSRPAHKADCGLNPTIPLMDDGQDIDPLVSVPIATSTIPAATATAEPELEPHGLNELFKKCVVCPP